VSEATEKVSKRKMKLVETHCFASKSFILKKQRYVKYIYWENAGQQTKKI